jgi:hypothetical protein
MMPRLIRDTDAQHRLVALAVKRKNDAIPMDMITYILFHDTPEVDAVEVVHGKWEIIDFAGNMRCSVCGQIMDSNFNYCANCGAKMTEGVCNET